MLARQQKVDLAKISILALADQYLAFIEEARKLRLELAADYLVMAAWLAYLKSRLLLPDATRRKARAPRTWRTRSRCASSGWRRSAPSPSKLLRARSSIATCSAAAIRSRSPTSRRPQWSATLYDLLSAYAAQRQRQALAHVRFRQAHRLVAGRGARRAGAPDRAGIGLEPARSSTCSPMWSSRRCGRPSWRRALRPRSKWCARA